MQQQIKALTEAIRQHDYAYYVLKQPIISDQHYDAMFAKLICLEAEHPELIEPNSPTTRVGSDITNRFRKYPHPEPMLSVRSFYSISEFKKAIPELAEGYTVEYKLDGISIEIEYRNGQLFRALTRGNGIEGEDVTDNIRILKSIPLEMPGTQSVVVRGEIIITETGLREVNKLRKASKLEPYPNQRNAAASLVMLKNSAELYRYAVSGLKAYFYHIVNGNNQIKSLFRLQNFGFKTPDFIHAESLIKAVFWAETMMRPENKTTYPVDGVIIKANNKINQDKLGQTMRHVNWAWALKDKSETIITRFHYIEYAVSKLGTITPIVHFKEIFHNGIRYKCAKTDWKTLESLKLSLLCNIHITIKGSVSAEITGASNNDPNKTPVVEPVETCPACKQPLTIGNNTRKCENQSCVDKVGNAQYSGTHKLLERSFASFDITRFAAANTSAIVTKNARSHAPIIFYRSVDQLAEIMFNIGIIGNFA